MVLEEERKLKRLRRMVNALLASGAYSVKEEERQIVRMTAQLKGAHIAVDEGLLSQQEYEALEEQLKREKAVVRRAWKIRRKIAQRLLAELEQELDELEREELERVRKEQETALDS